MQYSKGQDMAKIWKSRRQRSERAIVWSTRGEWWYQVCARNGKVVDSAEEGLKRIDSVLRRLRKRWPGVFVFESKVGRPKRGFRIRRDVYDAGLVP